MTDDLPGPPRKGSIETRQRLAEWLQEVARELIVDGSVGVARSVALDRLRARGINPTEQQLQEVEAELRKKGEQFADNIIGDHHDTNPFEPDNRSESDGRAGDPADHSRLRGPEIDRD